MSIETLALPSGESTMRERSVLSASPTTRSSTMCDVWTDMPFICSDRSS
ncbi:MAG: hypothetical protein IT374_08445 [Polyangiaceae bacterium]|nr:hypothetical protein [Polyangiaceae bacterium]